MSNRRIRSISKLTRVGNVEVCLVLRVDADRGYIDLSKKRVAAEDGAKAREAFGRAKLIHGIMRHVATIVGTDLASICKSVSWPLYKEFGPAKAYDTLRRMVLDNSIESIKTTCPDLVSNTQLAEALLLAAGRKLTPHEVRMRALFDLNCFATEGVNAIKEAVAAVKAESADQVLTIKLISAPQFLIETSGIGKEACASRLEIALEKIKQQIEARGGIYRLRSAPDVIGEDEEELPKFDEDVSSDSEQEGDIDRSEGESSDDSSSDSSSESFSSEDEKARKKKSSKKGRK